MGYLIYRVKETRQPYVVVGYDDGRGRPAMMKWFRSGQQGPVQKSMAQTLIPGRVWLVGNKKHPHLFVIREDLLYKETT